MGADDVKNFMGYLWVRDEDGVLTIGLTEEALEDFSEIHSIELPQEQEKLEGEEVCGTIETDDGPLDIYAPVSGVVLEVNTQVVDDPSLIFEDPYEEGWLLRMEAEEPLDEEDEDSEEDDEDLEEDEDEESER